jgi:site-specific recombinase XerC
LLVGSIYGFAIGRGLASDNPARGVKKAPVRKVERFLSEAEIARLAEALDAETERSGNPYPSAAIKLLLLTGCRRGEIISLRWQHVDFTRDCLRLPDSKTGAKVVYLNPPARLLLEELPRIADNPLVIPGLRVDGGAAAIQKAWDRVRIAAVLANVRLHDLRHSFASVGAAGGLSLPIIGALLGHKHAATTARYAHLAADPLRAANDVVGARIAAAMSHGTRATTPADEWTYRSDEAGPRDSPYQANPSREPNAPTHVCAASSKASHNMTTGEPKDDDTSLNLVRGTIGPDDLPSLNRALDRLFGQLREARRIESLDNGRATAIGYQLAMMSFLMSFHSASTEGLHIPTLNLASALLALNNNHVEPILEPTKRTGRPVSGPQRFVLMGIAVGAARRLEWIGVRPEDADQEIANKLAALRVGPARSSGGINARTVRDWRERIEEIRPRVPRFTENSRQEISPKDLGLVVAACNADDMVGQEWFDRVQAMPPGDARTFILDALEQAFEK